MNPILIIGAKGQIGSELSTKLIQLYGEDQVILSDVQIQNAQNFEQLDILDSTNLERIIIKYNIQTVVNLAALLSAKGEKDPSLTWKINVDGLLNILELSVKYKYKIFQPSSIAVFGPNTSKISAPQNVSLQPSTMYGVTKVAGESLCNYYALKYDVDVRSVRFPGVIGGYSLPGGGTTDYAVEIFHKAIQDHNYSCYLNADTALPMIYMDDAIDAILSIMTVPKEKITVRTSYNINSLSFTPSELSKEIKKNIPDFEIRYDIDERQLIADSWPASLDDRQAINDWNWNPKVNLQQMTIRLLEILNKKYKN